MPKYHSRTGLEEAIKRGRAVPRKQTSLLTFQRALKERWRAFGICLADGLTLEFRRNWYDEYVVSIDAITAENTGDEFDRWLHRFGVARVWKFKEDDMPALLTYIAAVGGVRECVPR